VCDDGGDQEVAISAYLDPRGGRCDAASGVDRRAIVTARGQSSGLARSINTAHLHRHRGHTRQAQHQNHDQRCDRECRFNGARAGTPGYTLVLSARPMMLVNADTMESPVTTV